MSADRLLGERIARNEAAFREANEQINAAAEAYNVDMRVPFICECADPSCKEIVRIPLPDYEEIRANPRHFLNVPGHERASGHWSTVVADRDGYLIAEKLGHAGDTAEALDERIVTTEQEAGSSA